MSHIIVNSGSSAPMGDFTSSNPTPTSWTPSLPNSDLLSSTLNSMGGAPHFALPRLHHQRIPDTPSHLAGPDASAASQPSGARATQLPARPACRRLLSMIPEHPVEHPTPRRRKALSCRMKDEEKDLVMPGAGAVAQVRGGWSDML